MILLGFLLKILIAYSAWQLFKAIRNGKISKNIFFEKMINEYFGKDAVEWSCISKKMKTDGDGYEIIQNSIGL